jgi:hypothetical protein
MLLLDYCTMRQGLGERLAFWLSTANFAAPFLGVVETGQKCLKTGLSDLGTFPQVAATKGIFFSINT